MTGTLTIESDSSKPKEHMVPESRRIHRRFYDGGANLTPTIQSTVCKKKNAEMSTKVGATHDLPVFEITNESKGNELEHHLQHKNAGEKVI